MLHLAKPLFLMMSPLRNSTKNLFILDNGAVKYMDVFMEAGDRVLMWAKHNVNTKALMLWDLFCIHI